MELSEQNVPVWRIAHQMKWRPETIRKWRQRGREKGRAGLVSQMGRPKKGAMSSYPEEMRTTLLTLRQTHEGWGPATLVIELGKDSRFAGCKLPSQASVARFLKEQELVKKQEKHAELPKSQLYPANAPHEVWQMDAKGYDKVEGVGMVMLVNVNDRASHARLLSYPCQVGDDKVTRHANRSDYQIALRLAFTDWGLPRALQVDHESVFYDNKTKSPFPTPFHLWLVALGIKLCFSRVHTPTDQAMTERSHQLWYDQVIKGQTFHSWLHLYQALLQRRHFLNYELPCASLGQLPIMLVHPHASHSGRHYRPEYEEHLLDLTRVHSYLSHGRWFRRVGGNGTISLGGSVYYLGNSFQQQQVELSFDAQQARFLCHASDGSLLATLPPKNLSKDVLIGSLQPFFSLHTFQPMLPFDWDDRNVLRLFEILDDTT